MKCDLHTFDNEKKERKTMKTMRKTMKNISSISKEIERMATDQAYGLSLYNREQEKKQEKTKEDKPFDIREKLNPVPFTEGVK